MLYRSLKRSGLWIALAVWSCAGVSAQVNSPRPPAPPPDTLIVEPSTRQSPQIVTVVHRLNGIKALALLGRRGDDVTMVDDDILTAPYAVTSITAGFALGDGQSIVARLPQAEAEFEAASPGMTYNFQFPAGSTPMPAPIATPAASTAIKASPIPARASGFIIVQSNGKQYPAQYIGLDGGSGLSLLKILGLKVAGTRDVVEERLAVGQTVRLFAPVRTSGNNPAPSTVSLRVGEIEGRISEILRTSTGRISRLSIQAPNASAAIVGGVALNEAGEIVGIVERSSVGTAQLIPVAAVRRAAERVLTRQASVPRPWLGVKGEPVMATPLEKFYTNGWSENEAAALKRFRQGILLTSVAKGTPAALANLRPGDVIMRVNNLEVKSGEDFSYILNEAGGGATVNFTIYRVQRQTPSIPPPPLVPPTPLPPYPKGVLALKAFKPFDVSVKLGESLNPAMAMSLAEGSAYTFSLLKPVPPVARGIETARLSQKAAAHLGARGGLLVLYVDPQSPAAQSGLQVFDVIESVEGKPLEQASLSDAIPQGSKGRLVLGILRGGKRIEIKVQKDEPER